MGGGGEEENRQAQINVSGEEEENRRAQITQTRTHTSYSVHPTITLTLCQQWR